MSASRWLRTFVVVVAVIGHLEKGRVLAQEGDQELPADFVLPDFDCKFQGQFPYMVSVRDKTPGKDHICGGIVIAEDAVLTAAHCVDPRASKKATVTPDLHVGGFDSDEPIQKRKTARAFPHPKWTGTAEDGNDLIVLKLNETVCLKPVPQLGAPGAEDRRDLLFLGYGRTAIAGSFSFVLQAGQFNTFNLTHCNERFDIDPPLKRGDLCVRSRTSVGICSGDDGSPLILQPSLTVFRDVLIGIASFTTAECTETEGAAVFMDIDKYKEWIKETLESKEFKDA